MDQFCRCPRCGNHTFEHLQTYSHCVDCFYFEDRHYDTENAYFEAHTSESLLNVKAEKTLEDEEAEDELAS